ncbi:MAG TPA: transglycosylase domain-containing protein [Myxococcaceae bacterium]|nr:transglycosylase domain-containing protein [Myxococcaceae bacterium]
MRTLFWLALFLLGLTGVMLPISYLWLSSKLPPMESEFDIEKQLKHTIEGDRMSLVAGLYVKPDRPITFNRPDFSRLPKDLVAMYITEMGCPTYFQTPREEGVAWGWRLFHGALVGGHLDGDGGCERVLALRIARKLGVKEPYQLAVASHKIHSVMQKDQLLAYDLAILRFERGVVGVEDVTLKVFNKELDKLSLSELAELMLILPPYLYYDDIRNCRNGPVIKSNRDSIIAEIANWELITPEKAKNAIAQPVSCLTRK